MEGKFQLVGLSPLSSCHFLVNCLMWVCFWLLDEWHGVWLSLCPEEPSFLRVTDCCLPSGSWGPLCTPSVLGAHSAVRGPLGAAAPAVRADLPGGCPCSPGARSVSEHVSWGHSPRWDWARRHNQLDGKVRQSTHAFVYRSVNNQFEWLFFFKWLLFRDVSYTTKLSMLSLISLTA